MSFLSGILGALGGPVNIVKSVGEFVSDSLSNIASGKPIGESLLQAGSHAINTLVGKEEPKTIAQGVNKSPFMQVTHSRPVIMNRMHVNREMQRQQHSLADRRPAIITNGNQPAARLTSSPVYKDPHLKKYEEVRGTNAGFPNRKYYVEDQGIKMEPEQQISKRQMKKMRKQQRKQEEQLKFKNYME